MIFSFKQFNENSELLLVLNKNISNLIKLSNGLNIPFDINNSDIRK